MRAFRLPLSMLILQSIAAKLQALHILQQLGIRTLCPKRIRGRGRGLFREVQWSQGEAED